MVIAGRGAAGDDLAPGAGDGHARRERRTPRMLEDDVGVFAARELPYLRLQPQYLPILSPPALVEEAFLAGRPRKHDHAFAPHFPYHFGLLRKELCH